MFLNTVSHQTTLGRPLRYFLFDISHQLRGVYTEQKIQNDNLKSDYKCWNAVLIVTLISFIPLVNHFQRHSYVGTFNLDWIYQLFFALMSSELIVPWPHSEVILAYCTKWYVHCMCTVLARRGLLKGGLSQLSQNRFQIAIFHSFTTRYIVPSIISPTCSDAHSNNVIGFRA